MHQRRRQKRLDSSRRAALHRLLFGATGMGLRSFVTGIPLPILLGPRAAMAQELAVARGEILAAAPPQFLIISSSQGGDPLNCNVPGTYLDNRVAHPTSPAMAATQLTLGGKAATAALPWSTLAPATLARTNFFHHRTDSVGHGDLLKSLRLSGGISRGENLPSLLSSQNAAALGTVQAQPITLGATDAGEALTYAGRGIPMLTPSSLKDVLTMANGPLKNARALRDDTLNKLTAWYKSTATAGQSTFLDRWANSQADLRKVSDTLLNNLAGISDNGPNGQVAAAVALLQLKASPVVSVHISFGEDNHGDVGLAQEATQTASGVATINALMAQLGSAGLADQTTFATLNVFGRTLAARGMQGRDHNEGHHVSVLIGKNIRPGITGGIQPATYDYVATGIDSTSGAATAAGDVAAADSYAALAKSLGVAVGVPVAVLNDRIAAGKVVAAAVLA